MRRLKKDSVMPRGNRRMRGEIGNFVKAFLLRVSLHSNGGLVLDGDGPNEPGSSTRRLCVPPRPQR